jgi:hypothetical protein
VKLKLGLSFEAKDLNFRISSEYHQFMDGFGKRLADAQLAHRSFDHAIDLNDGTYPPWGPIYTLSAVELKALRDDLDEMLRPSKIWSSTSPGRALIFFIPKANGKSLPLCVDYQRLNKIIVLNR